MRLLSRLGLACLAVLWATFAQSQTIVLYPEEVRIASVAAIEQGEPGVALELANALILRDPKDLTAWKVKSRAARNMGIAKVSVAAARRAWALSRTDLDKYESAMLMAQALSSQGSRTRAQLWLRRAVQFAPTPQLRAVAIRDFRYVRTRNPWSTTLSFSVAPTSNANNGSANSTTRLFDLPFEFQLSGDAQALSGTEFSGGLSTTYQFPPGSRGSSAITARVSHRTYVLSDTAKALAPDAKGSDFALTTAALTYTRRFVGERPRNPLDLSIGAGQNWYGGSIYTHFVQGRASKTVVLSPLTRLRFSLGADRQLSDRDAPSANSLSIGTAFDQRLANGGALHLAIDANRSRSDSDINDFRTIRASIAYDLPKPVLTARTTLSLTLQSRDYDRSPFAAAGRRDDTVEGSIGMVFTKVDYYGFSPTVALLASRTNSNIGLFDTRELGLRIGFQSAF